MWLVYEFALVFLSTFFMAIDFLGGSQGGGPV